jgi:hypothetical protein
MKKALLSFLLLSMVYSIASAQVSVTATAGTTSGTYTTLGDAFTAINSGTHKGVITIRFSGSTTEPATANLDSSGNASGSNYTSISIEPLAATAATITGSVAGPLINLNGADNITIDGIALAPGGATLTINNTSNAATASTVKFINDATSNTIKNTTLKGAGVSLTTGVVLFSTGLLSGNDNNSLLNNDIDCTGSAMIGLYSSGTNTTTILENSGNTVSNCWIHDFFNATFIPSPSTNPATFYGVYLASGNTDWTFNANSFYQSVLRTVTINSTFTGMLLGPSYTSDKHTVTANYFGGSAPGASNVSGNMQLSGSGTVYAGFTGFSIQTGGSGNLVDANIVRNITLTSFSTSSPSNAGFFGYIGGYNGTSTFSNNQVSDINLINNATGGFVSFQGIYVNGRTVASGTVTPTFTVNNNSVSNIIATSSVNADFQFYGLRLETSSATSLTSAAIANVTFSATGNTVNSFTITSATSTSTFTFVRGIGVVTSAGTASSPLQPKATLTNNTVRDLVVGGARASYTTPTVSGIQVTGAVAVANSDVQNITGNTIYNLSATTTADVSNSVAGIIVNNSTYSIDRNRIYGLSNSSPGTTSTPIIAGIDVQNAVLTSTLKNNFISVGGGVTTNTNIFGIINSVTSSGALNFYFNSVYVTGISASKNSAAFYRGNETMSTGVTTTVDIRDNIFYNFRSGGTGANYAIGTFATGTWTSDYNVLKSTVSTTVANWNNIAMDLPTYQAASGQDTHSNSTTVNFVDASTADLHLTGASNGDANLRGVPVTGITTDYDNQTRSSFNPYIGADEASISLPVQLISFTGTKESINNKLLWSTSSEVNNKGFELERSADGKTFSTIAFVQTKADKGYSTTTLNYSYADEKPLKGANYYRLKQVDNDGRIIYSSVVVLKGEKIFAISAIYPNPTKDQLNVVVSSEKSEKATLTIVDINGKVMQQMNTVLVAGDNNITLNVGAFSTGTYYVRFVVGDDVKTTGFIKR